MSGKRASENLALSPISGSLLVDVRNTNVPPNHEGTDVAVRWRKRANWRNCSETQIAPSLLLVRFPDVLCVETTYILLMSCARFPEMVLRKSKRTPRKIPGSRKHVAEYGKS